MLQEAPHVFSDAISEACKTHNWEIFCCFSGRILGGIVSTDIRVTLPFSLFHILLYSWRHICWLDILFYLVLSLFRSYRWSLPVSYLTI